VPHLARFCAKRQVKSGKKPCQVTSSASTFHATTPCENELFAADGQIVEREGSHNVKIYTEYFTSSATKPNPDTTSARDFS